MKQIFVFAIVFFQIIFSTGLSAQNVRKTTEELYEISTINGDKYTGYINRMDDTNIIIDIKEAGLLTLKREYIKSIKKVYPNSKNNKTNLPQKYLYDKSAFPLGKGNFYYANTMLMINDFVYGITDHLTAESNINFYSLFDGGFEDVGMSFSMNYSSYLIKNKLTFLGGVRYSRLFKKRYYYDYYDYRIHPHKKNILALSGILTLGDKSNNLSLGFKYPFSKYSDGLESSKIINFSGMVKITNSTSFMFDLLAIIEDSPLIITINARSKIKGIYLDYGFLGDVDDSGFEFFAPLLSIKIPFIQTSWSY